MTQKDYAAELKAATKKRAKVVQMHKNGKKHREIGNALNISHQRVSQILSDERTRGNLK